MPTSTLCNSQRFVSNKFRWLFPALALLCAVFHVAAMPADVIATKITAITSTSATLASAADTAPAAERDDSVPAAERDHTAPAAEADNIPHDPRRPLWFGPPEPVPSYVVPARQAQRIELSAPVSLLTFSADSAQLAIATLGDTQKPNEFGPVHAAELYTVPVGTTAAVIAAKLRIPKETTARFAVYGAPPAELRWQGDDIELTIYDGDDSLGRLTYQTRFEQLKSTDFTMVEEEDYSTPSPLAKAIGRCFTDWNAEVISSGIDGRMLGWLTEKNATVFQARHVDMPDDIWYLDLDSCQRNPLITLSKTRRNYWISSIAGAAQQGNWLLLALQQTPVRGDHRMLDLLLSDQGPGIPLQQRQWLPVSINAAPNQRLHSLGSFEQRELLLLKDNQQWCEASLWSLSAQGLVQMNVDGYQICQAAISGNGQLALSLAKITRGTAAQDLQPDTLWLIPASFIRSLPR